MNILILISSLHIGGAEKQAVNDANMLCDEHEVFLVVFNDGALKDSLDSRVHYHRIEKSGYCGSSKLIGNFIKEKKIDIIHASLFAPMIIGALASIRVHTPIVWSFHSHEYDIPTKSKLSFMLFSRLNNLKKITYVNKELQVFFEKKLKLPSSKSMVLYNTTEYKTCLNQHTADEVINIGYVGRIIELKRVEYLVDTAVWLKSNNVNNFIFHLIGDGEAKESIESMVKQLKLSKNFKFYGFQTDLEKYYDVFDIFINPSREECLSIALIDACIKGVPSIAFDVGGNDEIIIDKKTGFIVNSKKELFYKVKELIEKADKRLSFGEEAKKHCKVNFSVERRKELLNQIFISAIAKGN